MKIWLPDSHAEIVLDTGTVAENRISVHQQRITMTLQPIKCDEPGFGKEDDDA